MVDKIDLNNDMKINENMRVDYSQNTPTLVINKPSDKKIALNFPSVDYVEKPSDSFSLSIDNIIADTINFDTSEGRRDLLFEDTGIFGAKNNDWVNLPVDNFYPIVTSNYTKLDSTINNDSLTKKTRSGDCYIYPYYPFDKNNNCIIELEYVKSSNDDVKIGFCDDFYPISSVNFNTYNINTDLGITESGIIKIVKLIDNIYFYFNNLLVGTYSFTLDDDYNFVIHYNNQIFCFKNFSIKEISTDYNLETNDFNVDLVDSDDAPIEGVLPIVNYDTGSFNDVITLGEYIESLGITINDINNNFFNSLKFKTPKSVNDTGVGYTFQLKGLNTGDTLYFKLMNNVHNIIYKVFRMENGQLTFTKTVTKDEYDHELHSKVLNYADDDILLGFFYRYVNNEWIIESYYRDSSTSNVWEYIEGDDTPYYPADFYDSKIDGFVVYDTVLSSDTIEDGGGINLFLGTYNNNNYNNIQQALGLQVLNLGFEYNKDGEYDSSLYQFYGSRYYISNGIKTIETNEFNNLNEYNMQYGGNIKGKTCISIGEQPMEYDEEIMTFDIDNYHMKWIFTNAGTLINPVIRFELYKGNTVQPMYSATDTYTTEKIQGDNNYYYHINFNINIVPLIADNILTGFVFSFKNNEDTTLYNLDLEYDSDGISIGNISFWHNYIFENFEYDVTKNARRYLSINTYDIINKGAVEDYNKEKVNFVNPFNYNKMKIIFNSNTSNDGDLLSINVGNNIIKVFINNKTIYYKINDSDTSYPISAIGMEEIYDINHTDTTDIYSYKTFEIINDNGNIKFKTNKDNRKEYAGIDLRRYYDYDYGIILEPTYTHELTGIYTDADINILGNCNVNCITYEIPEYESSIYTKKENGISINNDGDISSYETIKLSLTHEMINDNYIYLDINKVPPTDFNDCYLIFKDNNGGILKISLEDINEKNMYIIINDNIIDIYGYVDSKLTKVYTNEFNLTDVYRMYITGEGGGEESIDIDINSIIIGRNCGEFIDDAIKSSYNPFMVGSINAYTEATINGTIMYCKRDLGNGYLMPTSNGEYGNPKLIKRSSVIEFDYIYHEDIDNNNMFGIVNKIGNQVEYITFNELDIDDNTHIKIEVENEFEQVGVEDMTANIKVYTSNIKESGAYTPSDYTLKYDKDVSISLLRAGYYFVFKQKNNTSIIQYKNFSISNLCYDYTIKVIMRGYTKDGIIDTHNSRTYAKEVNVDTNTNRFKVSFVNVDKSIEYIDFIIIFDDDRLNKIEISKIMLSEGVEDAMYSTDNKIENLKNSDINFTNSFYCNYYNHHESDPVGLCIIRPSREKINLTKIPAPNLTDNSNRGTQAPTVLYPYLKKCKKEDEPENVAIEYLNSCNQTLKCVYNG